VVLAYNTTNMNSTDKLQITIDEPAELFVPDEAYQDPVGKFRISAPQALIDTDFEYGLQPTKWETISLLNNRAGFYVNTQSPLTISQVTATNGSANIVVTASSPPAVGTPFLMQDSTFTAANGPFVVELSGGGVFSYTARYPYTGTTGTIYNASLTQVYTGSFYSNAAYALSAQPTFSSNVVTITTSDQHGLVIGDQIYITGATATTNPPNGTFQVAAITNPFTLQVITNTPTGTISTASVYPNPGGIYTHRAYDGGVQFTTGNPAHNLQTIRQTRRYFRYQSGKGLQISTGTILKPNLNVDELSAVGTTVTVTTKLAHQLNPGVVVTISSAADVNYNGTWAVDQVLNANQFTYIAAVAPTTTPAAGLVILSVTGWSGASVKLGMFDFQNGFYFEHDGTTTYACRRKSTDQIAGYVNVTNANAYIFGATVNGVTTKFTKQLAPGDNLVIKGMTYRVNHIHSDTQLSITPPYRGTTLGGSNVAIVSKTIDIRIPQTSWNIDKCDGTGPSGHVIDLSKMQMFYIDYSWYGAGTIRMGFRDSQGRVFYCHRFVNANQNYEAYMRSGNLPARYEVSTFSANCQLTASMLSGDTSMTVNDTSTFANVGTLLIHDLTSNGYEYAYYTGKTPTSFTGLTRGKASTTIAAVATTQNSANVTTASAVTGIQPGMFVYGPNIPTNTYVAAIYTGGTNTIKLTQAAVTTQASVTLNFNQMGVAAAAHTYSATQPIQVYQHAPNFSPTISHWGTSVMMDGRFDDDKSLVFLYGEQSVTTILPGITTALLSIRVSPSVDSGVTGTLGVKEIINRMQLKLFSAEVLVSGSFLIQLVLNGTTAAQSAGVTPAVAGTLNSYARIATGTSSLSQICDHIGNCSISGGETIYGFYAVNSAGSTNFSDISVDLTPLRDLGNSIIAGGLSNVPNNNIYPDGPDVLTVVATNIGPTFANIYARLGWTEAQA